MRSLRARLILATTLAAVAIYALAAVAIYFAIRVSLLAEFDQTLRSKAQTIVAIAELNAEGPHLEFDAALLPEFQSSNSNIGFILRTHEGAPYAHAGLAEAAEIPAGDSEQLQFSRAPGGRHLRALTLRFIPRVDPDEKPPTPAQMVPVELVIVRDAAPFDARINQLAWLLAGIFAFTALVTAAVMTFVVGRGLRPLGQLAAGIQRLPAEDLAARVSLENAPAEIAPVVARLNELLARLEESFSRERAFTADVAHELRTPLAALIMALEVTASQPRTPAEYESSINKCIRVSKNMRGMIENLLTLARADANVLRPVLETVELEPLLRDLWQETAPRADLRSLAAALDVAPGVRTLADRKLLAMLLHNLFDNAVTYADPAGRIQISAARVNGSTQIRITNSGSKVAAADAPKVFTRFWRGDTARAGAGQNCGLGLPLCQKITHILHGSIAVETAAGRDFVVTVSLPSAS